MAYLDDITPRRRKTLTPKQRRLVSEKTGGLCHICGGELDERWAADHVRPFAKGGDNSIENFLPACYTCNRLKWHRSPEVIRFIMQLGIYAKKEIEKDSILGRKLADLFRKKEETNKSRRRKK